MLTFVAKSAGKNICLDPSGWFIHQGDMKWLMDDFVKEMVRDIDKSEVIGPNLIQSPVLGPIPPRMLSGGVRGLILLYKAESLPFTIAASAFGENCCKWLVEIGKQRDITLFYNYFMDFGELSININMKDAGVIVTNISDYASAAIKMLDEDNPELHFGR